MDLEKKLHRVLLKNLKHGTLVIQFHDGTSETFGKGSPKAKIVVKSKNIVRKILKSPSLAVGDAYVNGDIEVVGSLQNIIEMAEQNNIKINRGSYKKQWRKLHKNKKPKQKKYIAHHYDLGNDFYQLWLDKTMSYSCAYFKTKKDSLEQAQIQKTEHILRKLQLKQGQKLLDVGSGWGYLLVAAAKKFKIQGVGVTLSQKQLKYARQLAKSQKVEKYVKFQLKNYQDLPKKQEYDRIVSVGFYEHVGNGNLEIYFRTVNSLLKPGGISVLHSITHQKETPPDAWIEKYIFPGGYIPSVRETTHLLAEHHFYLFDYENLGQHYGMTLEKWWRNYEKNKVKVIDMYDEQFYRMWKLYLLGSKVSFKNGSTNLSQWTFKKGKNPDWPFTRDYLYI